MSITIRIGKRALEYSDDLFTDEGVEYSELIPTIEWEIELEDGTDDELSDSKNKPTYQLSPCAWSDWMSKYPSVRTLFKKLLNLEAMPVRQILPIINEITNTSRKTKLDRNRAKWLKFWAQAAVERLGEEAYIEIGS
jgi:hypothetical protein